jgi:hypothetical protein
VVTREVSDWSVAPVADWAGRDVHLRVSRQGDALTVRARCDGAVATRAPRAPRCEPVVARRTLSREPVARWLGRDVYASARRCGRRHVALIHEFRRTRSHQTERPQRG